MVELSQENILDFQLKLKRNGHIQYFVFCIVDDTGVVIRYPSVFHYGALGFQASLHYDLTKGLDSDYNVVIQYHDVHRGRTWQIIIPTQKPNELEQAIRQNYDKQ